MNIQTLHIFNPEHDIALAAGMANFTAPHAGRQLRGDLGYLPALWAGEGDAILADHAEASQYLFNHMRRRLGLVPARFVTQNELAALDIRRVDPWGWDLALSSMLRRKGVSAEVLPSLDWLVQTRQLSHRRTSARLLPLLQMEGTVGEAFECSADHELQQLRSRYGQLVLKAPWSSSGRGVRFDDSPAWIQSVIQRQGSIMAEPYYNKVCDFGMEFSATDDGVRYEGLSLFRTRNGAYTGNVLATEAVKRQKLARYLPGDLLERVCERVCSSIDLKDYRGPFGIDMMVVKPQQQASGGRLLLHPCVEINLRRTMGHVALVLERLTNPQQDDDIQRVMRVIYNGCNYKLKIER